MTHKHTLIGLVVSLSTLLPTAAFAHDFGPPPPPPGQGTFQVQVGHTASGVTERHGRHGRYERRMVSRWVQGRYESVWVPETCEARGSHHRYHYRPKFCVAAHYEQRWVPGHYEQVQDWVWVPAYRPGVSFRLTAGL